MFPTQFTGVSFTWERKKLGDVAEKVIQKNNNNAFKNVLTNSAEYGIISQRDFFERNIANKNNISTYYIVQNDDFVYNPRISILAPYGPINRNKTGYTGIISPLYYVFRVLNINTAFIEWYFKTTCWHKFMYQHGDSGARSDRFSIKDNELKKLPIKLPADDMEQEKIAKTLTSLDNTLQLHERKCEELTLIKKALLQKLFPKKEEVRPEVRYKNFSDAWEQRKFFDNIEKVIDFRGRTPKKLGMEWSAEGYTALSALNVKDGYIDFTADVHYANQDLYDKWMAGNELYKGQVLFTTEAPMGNVAQVPDNRKYVLSQRTIAFNVDKTKVTNDFLAVLLRSQNVQHTLKSLASGGTAQGVSQKSLSQLKVILPINPKEQQEIGNFFNHFDSLIALHQRKLEKLKQLKKFLLQNMFI